MFMPAQIWVQVRHKPHVSYRDCPSPGIVTPHLDATVRGGVGADSEQDSPSHGKLAD
jgi:hypothetical protein